MRTIARTMTLLLALPILLAAQTALTGKWQGKTPNGFEIELDLTVKETTLTGTLIRNGQPTMITDGKVSRNTFNFRAMLNDQTEGFTGELAGDEIKVWMDRQGSASAAVLKRVRS
jgi:hypothetical protein